MALFTGCNNLETINVPLNCRVISEQTFRSCSSLKKIYIPKSVEKIYASSFENCVNLTNIDISEENVKYEKDKEQIGIIYEKENGKIVSFFLYAPIASQETIRIPEGIKTIEPGTFGICSNMKKIELPNSLENIGGTAFRGLASIGNLEIIDFPNGNDKYIAENGYLYSEGEKNLIYVVPTKTEIIIKETVQSIETQSIDNNKITFLKIPDNVIRICSSIFNGASNLKTIYIGAGVKELDNNFLGGVIISEIIIDSNNLNYKTKGNFIITNDGKELVTVINKKEQSLIIPEGVEKLQKSSLQLCYDATEIILPNTLKNIENNVFADCTKIIAISIPSSVETIGVSAFSNCSNLAEIRIDKETGSIAGSPWGVPKGDRAIIWLR